MEKIKVVVLGANGMAGSMISAFLKDKGLVVYSLDKRASDEVEYMDVLDFPSFDSFCKKTSPDYVVNCIGILNEAAEKNKELAIELNSLLPHKLVRLGNKMNFKVIHLSTDCVFSGQKNDFYLDNDPKDGNTFYDVSKSMGELNDNFNLTFRNSIIGPDKNVNGIGLFNWIMSKRNQEVNGYTKAIWGGITTLVLAKAIHKAITDNLVGLYQLSNDTSISKFELVYETSKIFDLNIKINKSDEVIYFKALKRSEREFDFNVPTYVAMIEELKLWIDAHKELYPHYFEVKL